MQPTTPIPILIDYKEVTLTIEMRETKRVGHVKLFTNEIEALTHEMNKFGFVTPIFVVKSKVTNWSDQIILVGKN